MTRFPHTEMTPDGPAYEGRLLDRADEPVVDQGAPFGIRALVSRRGILGLVALGAGAIQVAGSDGVVSFTSIFPGCYDGRWPHIHFEVSPNVDAIADASNAIATSQVALPQDTCEIVYADAAYPSSASNLSRVSLADDNVFGEDEGALQLATTTGDNTTGWTVALGVRVDTSTTPTAGAAPGRRC
ncbi:hypothetical protein [Microbacterium trichothecenolyticum]|uniref:Dioxygenase-like protein n=1 Tax=Microbacterium trichothecenolyticum TaxID=69370 RepID=A0ABU0TRX7_MICTR|nr:hypothetical protein [Microbacterium trichothecenolyticum]MDQ1122436.1 hypothetical protein [Microbacterium trichothecenolyticum]